MTDTMDFAAVIAQVRADQARLAECRRFLDETDIEGQKQAALDKAAEFGRTNAQPAIPAYGEFLALLDGAVSAPETPATPDVPTEAPATPEAPTASTEAPAGNSRQARGQRGKSAAKK